MKWGNIYFLVKSSLVNKANVLMVLIKNETPIATTRAEEKTGNHHRNSALEEEEGQQDQLSSSSSDDSQKKNEKNQAQCQI